MWLCVVIIYTTSTKCQQNGLLLSVLKFQNLQEELFDGDKVS